MRRILAASICALFLAATPTGAGEAPEEVRFRTADGKTIRGEFHAAGPGGGRAAVVALHMFLGDRSQFEAMTPEFLAHGVSVLAIDLRGHGESAVAADREALLRRDPALFAAMRQDVAGAIGWLSAKGYDSARVGLVGASMGACVALEFAAETTTVPCVGLLTPSAQHAGLDPLGAATRYDDRPVLVASATEEAGKGARSIAERLTGVGAELRLIDVQSAHGTALFTRQAGFAMSLAEWFADHLAAGAVLDGALSDEEIEKAEVKPMGEGGNAYVRRFADHVWIGARRTGLSAVRLSIGDREYRFDSEGVVREGVALPLADGTVRAAGKDEVEVLLPIGGFGLARGKEIRVAVRALPDRGAPAVAEGIRLYYPKLVRRP